MKKGNRIMAANPQLDGGIFPFSRFQACAANLHQTVARLQAIEEEMADSVQKMHSQGASPERLLIAEDMLADLRAALDKIGNAPRFSRPAPLSVQRRSSTQRMPNPVSRLLLGLARRPSIPE